MIELLERQKRLTANQWKLIVTGNLADLLDFFDFFLIGYVLAFITKEWQLTYWQGAVILLSSGIGAVPGAFLGVGCRQDRPAQSVHRDRAQCRAGHRRHVFYARTE